MIWLVVICLVGAGDLSVGAGDLSGGAGDRFIWWCW